MTMWAIEVIRWQTDTCKVDVEADSEEEAQQKALHSAADLIYQDDMVDHYGIYECEEVVDEEAEADERDRQADHQPDPNEELTQDMEDTDA